MSDDGPTDGVEFDLEDILEDDVVEEISIDDIEIEDSSTAVSYTHLTLPTSG